MRGDTARLIITRHLDFCHLCAAAIRGATHSEASRSIMEVDAEREHAVKVVLDAFGYRFRFFRQYDEPNEIFASRLMEHLGDLLASSHAGGGL